MVEIGNDLTVEEHEAEYQRLLEERKRLDIILWEMELERLEWNRLQEDLFPGIKPETEE